jgi:hypothetical protein
MASRRAIEKRSHKLLLCRRSHIVGSRQTAQLHIVNSGLLFLVTQAQEVAPIIKQFLSRAGE